MPPEDTGQTGNQQSQGQTPPKLYAGRFKSVEELEAAYNASGKEVAEKLMPRLQKAESERDVYKNLATKGAGNTGTAPAQKTSRDALNEALVPVDALADFVGETVEAVVGKIFGPLAVGAQARQTFVGRFPDYPQIEGKVQQFLAMNPEKQERYNKLMQQGFAEEALDLSRNWFLDSPEGKELTKGTGDTRDVQNAGLPPSGTNIQPTTGQPGDIQAVLDSALDKAEESGKYSDVIALRLGGVPSFAGKT